ncbi:hypothetical protein D3C85_1835310 [compost metagenome]
MLRLALVSLTVWSDSDAALMVMVRTAAMALAMLMLPPASSMALRYWCQSSIQSLRSFCVMARLPIAWTAL